MRARSVFLALALSSLVACSSDSNDAGPDGDDGSDGEAGAHGQSSLVRVDDEPAGVNCPHGGTAIESGLDVNGNGVLDDDEVSHTAYVCAGPKGDDGAVIRLDDEGPGANCPHGGTVVKSGIDTNGNGVLDDDEVTATQYVCNGGVVGDVTISSHEGVAALAGVRHIVGMLTIEGGLTGEVALPNIEVVEGEIRVAAAAISGFKMPKLKRAGGVAVKVAKELVALEMPLLAEVGGEISLEGNPALEHFDFDALVSTGGFFISGQALKSLSLPLLTKIGASGFRMRYAGAEGPLGSFTIPLLASVEGDIVISWNESLESFAFPSLTDTKVLRVESNAKLEAFDVPLLASGSVQIWQNDSLKSFSLPALTSGDLISSNKSLESFSAPLLASGSVSVTSTENLQSFSLPALTNGSLSVYGNKALESFSAPLFASGRVQVEQNALLASFTLPKLATATDVKIGGPVLEAVDLPLLTSMEGTLSIWDSKVLETVELAQLTTIKGGLGVGANTSTDSCSFGSSYSNIALTTLSLPALTSIDGHLCIGSNAALETFEFPNLTSIGGDLNVSSHSQASNPALRSFRLPQLTSLGGDFLVGDDNGTVTNPVLESFELPLLASIGGDLRIGSIYSGASNPLLASFDLSSLRKVEGTDFIARNNPKLPTCLAENLYEQLDSPRPANKTISGNLGTCP